MKKLNFQPAKSKEDFRRNYKLHDLAEYHGKNLFMQWGIDFKDYGKDRRFERVWEKGADQPDIVAEYKDKQFLIDWKGKAKEAFWVNKRAIDSYLDWSAKLNLDIVIAFFIFDKNNHLKDRRFALLSAHKYKTVENKAWDKNEVVKFEDNLPKFTKSALISLLNSKTKS
jgi:Holliday junction resolvase